MWQESAETFSCPTRLNYSDDITQTISLHFIGDDMSTLKVPDMTCGHCVKSITSAIHEAAPDAEVSCDLTTKLVTVVGQHDAAKILQIVQEAGYTAEAV